MLLHSLNDTNDCRTKRDAIMSLAMLTPVINTILGALKIPIFKPKETEFFWDVIVQTLRSRIALKNRSVLEQSYHRCENNYLINLSIKAQRSY